MMDDTKHLSKAKAVLSLRVFVCRSMYGMLEFDNIVWGEMKNIWLTTLVVTCINVIAWAFIDPHTYMLMDASVT